MSELHQPVVITDGGPWAEHDHACAVCSARHSVLDLNTGMFQPCWGCQQDGWYLVRSKPLRRWLLSRPVLRHQRPRVSSVGPNPKEGETPQ